MTVAIFLALSFLLGLAGLNILGYRTNLREPLKAGDKGFVEPTWKASTEYFLKLLKGMFADLSYLVVIVIVVFSTVGLFFFLLSLMPYPLLKKFTT